MSDGGSAWGSAWERFWHRRAPSWPLGLFRILFAVALGREVSTTRAKSLFAVEGGFHLPYVDWIPLVSESTYGWLHQLQYPLIVLLGVGLAARWAAGGLLFLQGWVFFADQLNFRNHPYFFLLLLLILTVAPSDAALSLRWLWRRRRQRDEGGDWRGPWLPRTWQRLIQVEICLVYVYAGLHKLNPSYLGGEVVSRSFVQFARRWREDWIDWWGPERAERLVERFSQVEFAIVPSWLSVGLELLLPVALWMPRLRWVALALGVGFHVVVGVTMNIKVFSIAMIASYILFLPQPSRE